jgi:hypothetical protein
LLEDFGDALGTGTTTARAEDDGGRPDCSANLTKAVLVVLRVRSRVEQNTRNDAPGAKDCVTPGPVQRAPPSP